MPIAGAHHQVAGRRQVTVNPPADRRVGHGRGHDVGETPQRHHPPAMSPAGFGREEVPVTEGLAQHRVRHVVRGQADPVDAQQGLAVADLGDGTFE
jgi:hypothetical protein